MKKFYYMVGSYEFEDTKAFGSAWAAAKEKAIELHTHIARRIVSSKETRDEVFCNGGIFIRADLVTPDTYKVF